MKKMKNIKWSDLLLSFREIGRYDKKILFLMVADVIIGAVSPFPNIILAGLIVDGIVEGRDFWLVMFYVAALFGSNFF